MPSLMELVPRTPRCSTGSRAASGRFLPAARVIGDLHARLHAIPFGDARLVHFDLHPDNVLLGPYGPVLIDWTNARGGDPDADVALTWLIAETSAGLRGRLFARLFRRIVGRDAAPFAASPKPAPSDWPTRT